MSFAGFAVTNPWAAMSMLDANKWRCVFYADTPRVKERYARFIDTKPEERKAVLLVLGGVNLHRVAADFKRFHSVLVFDDVQNMERLTELFDGFEIVDIGSSDDEHYPCHLTPAEMADLVAEPGGIPVEVPFLSKVTAALGKRKPSVLETTSRMPEPELLPESGAQRLLTEIKNVLDYAESPLPFPVVLDNYTKFLFRMLPRSKLTSQVTKKLPADAKELWSTALDLATSDIGRRMALAFRALCESTDPDYRVGQAVAEYGLRPYSGDFVYFTAVMAPNRSFEFLDALNDDDIAKGSKEKFVPPVVRKKAKKKTKKKA